MNDEGKRRKEEKLEKQKSGKAIGKDEGETMNDEGEKSEKAEKRKSEKLGRWGTDLSRVAREAWRAQRSD